MQSMVTCPGQSSTCVQPERASMSFASLKSQWMVPSSPRAIPNTQPFASAEEAWMWTMAALIARREGARYTAGKGLLSRPCDPDDVVKCLDGLYRQRRITLMHARVLRIWGERQTVPSLAVSSEKNDYRLWSEAL